jgi:hypothetical protein
MVERYRKGEMALSVFRNQAVRDLKSREMGRIPWFGTALDVYGSLSWDILADELTIC